MQKLAALVAVGVLACVPPAPAPPPPPPPPPLPAPPPPIAAPAPIAIGAEELRRDLEIFASDQFRGREAGTPDAIRAARFLVERLTFLGLEPAGDSGYYQRVPMVRTTFSPLTRVAVTVRGETAPRVLLVGPDVLPLLEIGEGVPPPRMRADGDIVFVGYGSAPTVGRNDLDTVSVRGRVVAVVNGAPASAAASARRELESVNALGGRLGDLIPRLPAAIVILIPDGAAEDLYSQFLPSILRSVSLSRVAAPMPDSLRPLPMILLARARPGSPFVPERFPEDDRPQLLTGRRLSASVDVRTEDFTGHNVVGIVRGSDPALNGSYVAFGAHYDHVGILPPVDGDSIANGADDDGSGSVALLAVARVLKARPSRRSTLFVWHAAEEKGLLGSIHFTRNPTVPIDSIVAQVNADMIGRNAPERLYIVGPAAAPVGQSRILGQIVDSVNAALPQPFRFNREWDSPTHPEQIYQRSDHFSYAQRGIPIVFLTSGLHPEYHGVDDEVSRIDFAKLARVGDLLARVGTAVGNRATRPR